MSTFDRHIQSILLQQRGQNQKLVNDVITLLPEDSKERLFRILQDMENEISNQRRKATSVSYAIQSALALSGR